MKHGLAALSFLEANSLDPTPDNYRLAYGYVTSGDAAIVRQIEDLAANGMRLTQEHADRIAGARSCCAPGADAPDSSRHERETAKLVASILEAAIASQRTTRDFGRDVAEEGRSLRENPTAEQLASGVRRMLERTDRAERELNAAGADIARLREELERTRQKADTDDLTGLVNRRGMRKLLETLDRDGVAYALAIIDIDHFKAINDDYGHDIGDRALRHVAGSLAQSLREHEVARWGGEEVLVLSRDPCAQRLGQAIDRARTALGKARLELRAADKPMRAISFSAGVSGKSDNADSTIRIADLQAYAAKRAGRDRVVVDAG